LVVIDRITRYNQIAHTTMPAAAIGTYRCQCALPKNCPRETPMEEGTPLSRGKTLVVCPWY
jgi:hypothetical protein